MIAILSALVFIIGYFFITLEHKFKTNKAAVALTIAGVLWIFAALSGISAEEFHLDLVEHGNGVFELVVFLLSAMTIVEVMIHLKFFDLIQKFLIELGLDHRKQFLLLSFLTFFLSAILDNLTVTIIMIQIARIFYKRDSLLAVAAGIVIAANSGGAWSPIGDVTTLMLWLAGKFDTILIIKEAIIPSIVLNIIASIWISKKLKKEDFDLGDKFKLALPWQNKIVIGVALLSFTLPMIMHLIHLPPYIGLMIGLGLVWLLFELLTGTKGDLDSHEGDSTLDVHVEHLIQKVDIPSLKFFIGILLAVGALESMGLLEELSHFIFGEGVPGFNMLVIGNTVIGLVSAIVDNVPLTALSIDVIKTADPRMWVLTALTVGTGGSFLVIGSVAGVIASGMLKELTFVKYLKIASLPALVGYLAAVAIWVIQYPLMG